MCSLKIFIRKNVGHKSLESIGRCDVAVHCAIFLDRPPAIVKDKRITYEFIQHINLPSKIELVIKTPLL